MAKKKRPVRKPARKPAARKPSARKPAASESLSKTLREYGQSMLQLGLEAHGTTQGPTTFVTLDSPEPGQVHIRTSAIEVISHPVQRTAGSEYILYVTLSSGQKTVILDTPENRTTLGLPFQPPLDGSRPKQPPPFNPRAPRLRRPATIAQPPAAADPNAEMQVRDENEDDPES